ncbi:flavin reductase family protein [Sphingobium fuliginis]|uniref:Flavin reductase family protein n=1 Tax=Sphingobium fuliginis ATCC 27551 TaxID=1208342 RepID=A0A5B8CKU1_SPHSA|nr:flavin reductase family protein [Sphingobium fuliginis]QDC39632.1 flavin reductase family protein [Sphingobium fuliginis ATCC 27551]
MTTANERVSPLDQRSFRDVLGHYPTGVCALTAIDDAGSPIVMVVGSFTSVSLDPPLVGFLPAKSSTSWPRIEQAREFCVNILGADQEGVCRQLSSRDPDAYARIPGGASLHGLPTIAGAIAWMDCRVHAVHDAGDHVMVLADVLDLGVARTDVEPLVFFRGAYRALA